MKNIWLGILFFIQITGFAQNPVNDVIGRYAGVRKVLNPNGTEAEPPCNCYFELWPNQMFSNCVDYQDSCFGGGMWDHVPFHVEVLADSSFQGFYPWDDSTVASGKLYANDSLFYRTFHPIPAAYNYWKEFRGFKLYAFVGIEELGLPENELMLSPQPASEELYIQSTQHTFDASHVPVLYDINGRILQVRVQYLNSNTFKADVSQLEAGIYFLQLQTNEGYVRRKIIVARP